MKHISSGEKTCSPIFNLISYCNNNECITYLVRVWLIPHPGVILTNFLIHGICVYVCMLVYNLIPNWHLEIKSLIILKISVCFSFHTEFVLLLKIYFHRELRWHQNRAFSSLQCLPIVSPMQGITGSSRHSFFYSYLIWCY